MTVRNLEDILDGCALLKSNYTDELYEYAGNRGNSIVFAPVDGGRREICATYNELLTSPEYSAVA